MGSNRAVSLINDAMFCRAIRNQRVICITEFIKGDLMKRGFSPEMLEVIPPGIDLAWAIPARKGTTSCSSAAWSERRDCRT